MARSKAETVEEVGADSVETDWLASDPFEPHPQHETPVAVDPWDSLPEPVAANVMSRGPRVSPDAIPASIRREVDRVHGLFGTELTDADGKVLAGKDAPKYFDLTLASVADAEAFVKYFTQYARNHPNGRMSTNIRQMKSSPNVVRYSAYPFKPRPRAAKPETSE